MDCLKKAAEVFGRELEYWEEDQIREVEEYGLGFMLKEMESADELEHYLHCIERQKFENSRRGRSNSNISILGNRLSWSPR